MTYTARQQPIDTATPLHVLEPAALLSMHSACCPCLVGRDKVLHHLMLLIRLW